MSDSESPMKKKLVSLGADRLADAILKISKHSDFAQELILTITSKPSTNVERYSRRISEYRNTPYFVDWKRSSRFANELSSLLEEIEEGVDDPTDGLELMVEFYKSDEEILNACDDSSGHIGDVFRYDAAKLFSKFASEIKDKEELENLVVELLNVDNFGVRDSLLDEIFNFLPESHIRSIVKRYWSLSEEQKDDFGKKHYFILIQVLAKQLKDVELYEKAVRAYTGGKLYSKAHLELAEICLDSGQPERALEFLDKADRNEFEKENLVLRAYRNLGDIEKQVELLTRMFNSHPDKRSIVELAKLLDKKAIDRLVDKKVSEIMKESTLESHHVDFLIEIGRIDEAECYLLSRHRQLDGDRYYHEASWVEVMEENGKNLVTVLLYRSLLDSILLRAKSKAYYYGVNYLKKMESLSASIKDWKDVPSHEEYFEEIKTKHKRKSSFWARYRGDD